MTNNVNEKQLEELHVSAKVLIETSNPEVVQKINETVQLAESEWKNTNDNIRNLRDKYERALDLWQKYRNSSDAIKNWAADRMGTINVLKPLDANTIEVISEFYSTKIESIHPNVTFLAIKLKSTLRYETYLKPYLVKNMSVYLVVHVVVVCACIPFQLNKKK